MNKVNICGIPESKFSHDGWCYECKNHCKMIPEVLVDEQIYTWAQNHGILQYGLPIGTWESMFHKYLLEDYFTTEGKYKSAPEYIKIYMRKHKLIPKFLKEDE